MKTLKNTSIKVSVIASAMAAMFAVPAQANILDDAAKAVSESTTSVNLRYRFESVDEDGKDETAAASTLKSRLTWKSGQVNGFHVNLEVDNVTSLITDDYNSTTNGKAAYPVVADPEGTDLNLANLTYKADKYAVTFGRQRIAHNDQRFVGGVAWRQNEQTYDGIRVNYNVSDAFNIDYSYVFNVNRIFGPNDGAQVADWIGNFHLLNSTYKINKAHKLNGFAYLLDNETAIGASSNTFGVNYSGKFGGLTANLSYASQSDAGDNAADYTASYYKAELSGKLSKVTLAAGMEVLGSDNGVGFSTPLATLHKFQGFADKFLGTPGTGVEDVYVKAVTKLGGVKVVAFYHDLTSDEGDIEYGQEFDLVLIKKFNKYATGMLKYANYNADQKATDTSKLWAMINVKF